MRLGLSASRLHCVELAAISVDLNERKVVRGDEDECKGKDKMDYAPACDLPLYAHIAPQSIPASTLPYHLRHGKC